MSTFSNQLPRRRINPCLIFSPLAWLKLQYFCHLGETEIGGFGVSSERDLLYVEDFVTVRQSVTPVTVRFDDAAVADFFDACVDKGISLARSSRLWCHTHPGASVTPSGTDEETFSRVFGRCDWSLMFILGRTGNTYARLACSSGPGAEVLLPTAVDWSDWPKCLAGEPGVLTALFVDWQREYAAHVSVLDERSHPLAGVQARALLTDKDWWNSFPSTPELDDVFYEPTMEATNEYERNIDPLAY